MSALVLVDGAQLFHATERLKIKIDYVSLKNILSDIAGEVPAITFFQPYNEDLDQHHRFVKFLSTNGFNVVTEYYELTTKIRNYWFSPDIAYRLGQHAEDKFFVISPDARLINSVADSEATLIFFRKLIDQEWLEHIDLGRIPFIDLDLLVDSLKLKREEV